MPIDQEQYIAIVDRLGALLDEHQEMKAPDYLRDMGVSSLSVRVPNYSGFREAILADESIRAHQIIFGMAYLFYEGKYKKVLNEAKPDQITPEVTEAFMKFKLLTNLEEHLSPYVQAMFADFRSRQDTKSNATGNA